jgi:hypothetical protein
MLRPISNPRQTTACRRMSSARLLPPSHTRPGNPFIAADHPRGHRITPLDSCLHGRVFGTHSAGRFRRPRRSGRVGAAGQGARPGIGGQALARADRRGAEARSARGRPATTAGPQRAHRTTQQLGSRRRRPHRPRALDRCPRTASLRPAPGRVPRPVPTSSSCTAPRPIDSSQRLRNSNPAVANRNHAYVKSLP